MQTKKQVSSLLDTFVADRALNWKLPVGTGGAWVVPLGVQAATRLATPMIEASASPRRSDCPRIDAILPGRPPWRPASPTLITPRDPPHRCRGHTTDAVAIRRGFRR